ncbi:MAG: uridine kinase [Planctomycetes bacterium]|nr:uridine kinase [Planctomycetota bacterium]
MARHRPLTIGIAGGSGSGKTSLARTLVEMLGPRRCAWLDHDSYYRDLAHLTPTERAAINFDHPDSLDNALLAGHVRELRAGRAVERPCYDFATHSRTATTLHIDSRPLVVCEGILLLAVPEFADSFDLRVFIDTPADVRILRRLQRDIVERGRTVESVARQYIETVRPMHERFVEPARATADLVLDWRHEPKQWAATVIATLRGMKAANPAARRAAAEA